MPGRSQQCWWWWGVPGSLQPNLPLALGSAWHMVRASAASIPQSLANLHLPRGSS